MELAELDWNVRKPLLEERPDTLPSVDDEGLETESCCLQDIKTCAVVFHFLARNLFPVEISAIGTTHQKAIRPLEECRVHQKIQRLLFHDDFAAGSRMIIEVFAKRLGVFSIRGPEIIVGLPSLRVIVIGSLHPFLFLLISANENVFAVLALISLSAGLPAIFPKRK